MKLVRIIIYVTLLLLLIVPSAMGAGNLVAVGTIPLGTMKNLISNDTLYTMEGNMIRAYDISPGVNLAALKANSYQGQVLLPNIVRGFAINGNTMYAVTWGSFHVIDISNKLHPFIRGNASKWTGGRDVVVEKGFAYIAGNSRLYVYDVRNPSAPTFYKEIPLIQSFLCRLVSDGKYLYGGYSEGAAYITIWNISIPGSPTSVKNYNYAPNGTAWTSGLSYRNNTLYVSQYYTALRTIDVSNRSNPKVLNTKSASYVHNTVFGNYLYTSVRYDGIRIYDISNNIPALSGSQTGSLGYSEQIATNGKVTSVSRWTGGLMLYNTTTKTAPKQIKNINIPGEIFVLSATTIGDMDVLASGGRNIGNWYWNITDPNDVNDVGYSYAGAFSPGNPRTYNIPWVGNYSYSEGGGNMGGAWVINMTNISHTGFANQNPPNLVFNKADNVESINAFDKWIFTESQYGWFRIWNNSRKDKATPTQVFAAKDAAFIEYSGDGHMWFQYNESDNLYLTNYHGMVTIINTAVPSAPTKIVPNATRNPHWLGRIAYNPTDKVVYGVWKNEKQNQYYISQVDVSDINNIHETGGSIQVIDSQTRDIACNGTDVFIVGRVGANVRMYDFSIPTSPVLVDEGYTMDGDAEGIVFYKGYLYTSSSGVITAWKVTPSSVRIPNLLQQTGGPQDQKPKQQSASLGGNSQNIITQIAGLWNSILNFIFR